MGLSDKGGSGRTAQPHTIAEAIKGTRVRNGSPLTSALCRAE